MTQDQELISIPGALLAGPGKGEEEQDGVLTLMIVNHLVDHTVPAVEYQVYFVVTEPLVLVLNNL